MLHASGSVNNALEATRAEIPRCRATTTTKLIILMSSTKPT